MARSQKSRAIVSARIGKEDGLVSMDREMTNMQAIAKVHLIDQPWDFMDIREPVVKARRGFLFLLVIRKACVLWRTVGKITKREIDYGRTTSTELSIDGIRLEFQRNSVL